MTTPVSNKNLVSAEGLKALGTCLDALKGLTNKDSKAVLQMLASVNGLRVESAFAVRQVITPPQKGGKKPKTQENPANKDPAVVALKKELATVSEKIISESKSKGFPLESDHPLVREKVKILANLKEVKTKIKIAGSNVSADQNSDSEESSNLNSPAKPKSEKEKGKGAT